ncbi:MAG TPA: response regulator [Bryobacteraceae bacterium]|nr:response regulator [Bryobacteraceae bacterium]
MAKARILVVDDEPAVLQFVAGVLERAEYEVAPAAGARQALAIIADADPFDLVVTDVVMPEMCGPELAGEIQARSPSSAIMFISGCVPVGQLPRGIPYLGKPFSPRDLLSAVGRVLSTSAA